MATKPKGPRRHFYKITEIAARWGLNRETVEKLVRHDCIPVMRFPGLRMYLVPASFVDNLEPDILAQWGELMERKLGAKPVPASSPVGTAPSQARPEDSVSGAALGNRTDRDPTQERADHKNDRGA